MVQRVAGEWTAVDRGGKVMEMLVKMSEVLVKITVMMMVPGSAPAPPEARGRGPPFLFFFLDLLPLCSGVTSRLPAVIST